MNNSSDNTTLNPIAIDTYQGIPLAIDCGPFIQHRLDDALETIESAMEDSPRLIISCFELLLPENLPYYLTLRLEGSLERFVSLLQRKARWKQTALANGGKIKKRATIDAVWQMDCTAQGRAFYRVMLLLNEEAYFRQHPRYLDNDTLQYRIRTTWNSIVGEPNNDSRRLISYGNHALSFMDNDIENLNNTFQLASVLCTAPAQHNGLAFQGFGATRKKKATRKKASH